MTESFPIGGKGVPVICLSIGSLWKCRLTHVHISACNKGHRPPHTHIETDGRPKKKRDREKDRDFLPAASQANRRWHPRIGSIFFLFFFFFFFFFSFHLLPIRWLEAGGKSLINKPTPPPLSLLYMCTQISRGWSFVVSRSRFVTDSRRIECGGLGDLNGASWQADKLQRGGQRRPRPRRRRRPREIDWKSYQCHFSGSIIDTTHLPPPTPTLSLPPPPPPQRSTTPDCSG